MAGLWKTNKEGGIVLHKDAISLCPSLHRLSEVNLKYIILTYDYLDSPYKQKPFEERKKMAIKELFENRDPLLEMQPWFDSVKEDYCSLIFDSKRASIDAINQKLAILNARIASPSIVEEAKLKGLSASIDLLTKQKERLESEVQMEDEIYEAKGKRTLNLLEKMKLSKQLYSIHKKEIDYVSQENPIVESSETEF